MAMIETLKAPPMVAVVASPGMGHLIPVGEFAKRLAGEYGFSVTFFSASVGPPTSAHQAYLDSLPDTIASILLPPVNLHGNATPPLGLFRTMAGSVPYMKRTLKDLTATFRVVALVADLFSSDVFDAAREFGLPVYLFSPINFMCLALGFHLPELDRSMRGREFRDLEEPVRLPGCVPFHGRDAPVIVQDRKSEAYRLLLRHCKLRYKEARGIFVNSFAGMEPGIIKALEKETMLPPLYPIGPLIRTGAARASAAGDVSSSSEMCSKWLDEQPLGSVMFICFGSGGALSPVQITELAMGLEMSQQRFLWVLRSRYPSKDPFQSLPEGFLRRTEGVGMVLPSWAPQEQVLAHPAVGGFMSHCGWNSTMESVAHGVPILAWPLYAEQRLNAVLLSEELGVALWPGHGKERKTALGREEVRKAVRELMGGEKGNNIRRRMLMLKESADMARHPGGSSHQAMSKLATQLLV